MSLTSKQESFCKAVALGGLSKVDAYTKAYPDAKSPRRILIDKGSELAQLPACAARIEELRERAASVAVKRSGLSLAGSMEEANVLMADALALGQISAGVAAAKLRAQLAGHLAEKATEKRGPLDDLDVAALLKLRDSLDAKLQSDADAAVLDLVGIVPTAPVRRVIR